MGGERRAKKNGRRLGQTRRRTAGRRQVAHAPSTSWVDFVSLAMGFATRTRALLNPSARKLGGVCVVSSAAGRPNHSSPSAAHQRREQRAASVDGQSRAARVQRASRSRSRRPWWSWVWPWAKARKRTSPQSPALKRRIIKQHYATPVCAKSCQPSERGCELAGVTSDLRLRPDRFFRACTVARGMHALSS